MVAKRSIASTRQLMWLLLGSLMTGAAVASEDVEGSNDLGFIERFPQSWIVDYSQQQVPDYSLATGRIKKINGVVLPESQRYLAGRLTRITYQIPTSRSSRQVLEHFERQFSRLAPQSLFSCDGRDCGDSNEWANIQLKMAKLYGIDREQFYRALRLDSGSGQQAGRYLAFYTVKRGNKRVYAQLDLIEANQLANPEAVAQSPVSIDQLGRQSLYRLAQTLTELEIDQLRQQLDRTPGFQLLLVGHSQQGNSLDEQQQKATLLAKALRDRLVDGGIAADRIEIIGLGGLVPNYDRSLSAERVELQLRPLGYIN